MLAFSQYLPLWSHSKSRRRADPGPISCCSSAASRRACRSLLLPGAKRWAGMVPGLRRRLCATLALLALVCILSPAWYRQSRAPYIATDEGEALAEECDGKRVFMYDLPPQLNTGALERCFGEMVTWLNFCPHALNNGFGKLLDFQAGALPSNSSLFSDFFTRRVPPAPEVWNATSIRQQVLGDAHGYVAEADADADSCKEEVEKGGSWFATDAYMLEQIYHTRMFHYPCLTAKPELASAFFLPYYSGLDALQYLYGEKRGRGHEHGQELITFLEGNAAMRPFWKRNGGQDHFMVAGRTGWDFGLESRDGWGTGLFAQPALENVTFLVLEGRGWRQGFEQAVPYPTSFHPPLVRKRGARKRGSRDGFGRQELREWMRKVKTARRTSLFAFAGAMRPGMASSIRGILHRQCLDANSNTSKLSSASESKSESESPSLLAHRRFEPVCAAVDCGSIKCSHNPQPAMDTFLHSEFCLQPRGDTSTRRSTFDSIVAGCIPVFFHPDSAYTQYKWHLPEEASSYSVYIPEEDVRQDTTVEEVLRRFSEEEVQRLRAALMRLLPRVIYMDLVDDSSSSSCAASHRNSGPLPSSAHQRVVYMEAVHVEDAFDVSVKGILAKIPYQTP